jgi:hypothetical protein
VPKGKLHNNKSKINPQQLINVHQANIQKAAEIPQ